MRSGLIFRASDHIANRFLLCRMISTSARKMHRSGISMSQSITQSLVALDGAIQDPPEPDNVASSKASSAVAGLTADTSLAPADMPVR
jgi:hypothetical protein